VPAAMVVPSPIVYTKVLVKKLVVGFQLESVGSLASGYCFTQHFIQLSYGVLNRVSLAISKIYNDWVKVQFLFGKYFK